MALERGRFDEAEAQFRRMEKIHRAVHGDKHYLVAPAIANRASVYVDRKQYARAEPLFRDAVRRYTQTLSPDHMFTAIAAIKLGRTLLREHRYAEAEEESLAGYRILKKQTSPPVSWLRAARKDLAATYEALHANMRKRRHYR